MIKAHAILAIAPTAQTVARARLLDLDDLGAVVAEHHADHGAGDQASQFDYPDPRERSFVMWYIVHNRES